MDLVDILSKEQIVPDLRAVDRWEAIDELIANLVATGKIKPEHQEAVRAVVRKRENQMSTGVGYGVGIPHGSKGLTADMVPEVVGALGRSKTGIDFAALDNKPVNHVLLFLVPEGQFQKHLHTLANIAKLLHRTEILQALEQAPDAEAMLKVIKDFGKK